MATYRLERDYQTNYDLGPDFAGPFPDPTLLERPAVEVLGLPARSRLGIAAGLLLNSKWIEVYAKLGFDLLTYKTVRSDYRPCYPPPNWVRIDLDGPLPADPETPLHPTDDLTTDVESATWAVCFGMPSMAPDVWRPDVEKAKRALAPGQLLNVSVVGTPQAGGGLDSLADDYVRCAVWAKESGADMVEANFSCPNVCSAEGQIYHDCKASREIAGKIRNAIGSTPLLIKAGYISDAGRLGDFLECLDGVADCVVMVNAIQRRVLHRNGKPVFGDYERVGILGRAIHAESVQMAAKATAIAKQRGLSIKIAGVGGVSSAQDAQEFFNAGVEAVFLGSSPMVKPQLAIEINAGLSQSAGLSQT